MSKPIRLIRITALEAACIALHWLARTWSGGVAAQIRNLADEMSDRAERLKRGREER